MNPLSYIKRFLFESTPSFQPLQSHSKPSPLSTILPQQQPQSTGSPTIENRRLVDLQSNQVLKSILEENQAAEFKINSVIAARPHPNGNTLLFLNAFSQEQQTTIDAALLPLEEKEEQRRQAIQMQCANILAAVPAEAENITIAIPRHGTRSTTKSFVCATIDYFISPDQLQRLQTQRIKIELHGNSNAYKAWSVLIEELPPEIQELFVVADEWSTITDSKADYIVCPLRADQEMLTIETIHKALHLAKALIRTFIKEADRHENSASSVPKASPVVNRMFSPAAASSSSADPSTHLEESKEDTSVPVQATSQTTQNRSDDQISLVRRSNFRSILANYKHDRDGILSFLQSHPKLFIYHHIPEDYHTRPLNPNCRVILAKFPQFKDDRDIMLALIKYEYRMFKEASITLQNDPEFVLAAIKRNNMVFTLVPHVQNDKRMAMAAVKQNCHMISSINQILQSDPDIKLASQNQNPSLHVRIRIQELSKSTPRTINAAAPTVPVQPTLKSISPKQWIIILFQHFGLKYPEWEETYYTDLLQTFEHQYEGMKKAIEQYMLNGEITISQEQSPEESLRILKDLDLYEFDLIRACYSNEVQNILSKKTYPLIFETACSIHDDDLMMACKPYIKEPDQHDMFMKYYGRFKKTPTSPQQSCFDVATCQPIQLGADTDICIKTQSSEGSLDSNPTIQIIKAHSWILSRAIQGNAQLLGNYSIFDVQALLSLIYNRIIVEPGPLSESKPLTPEDLLRLAEMGEELQLKTELCQLILNAFLEKVLSPDFSQADWDLLKSNKKLVIDILDLNHFPEITPEQLEKLIALIDWRRHPEIRLENCVNILADSPPIKQIKKILNDIIFNNNMLARQQNTGHSCVIS